MEHLPAGSLNAANLPVPAPALPQRPTFSPDNWAHQALLLMDTADSLVRWASVSMDDPKRYYEAAQAFWAVVHLLAAERQRLATLAKATPSPSQGRASRRRTPFQPVR